MALQTKTITKNGSNNHHTFTLTVVEDRTSIADNKSYLSWSFSITPLGVYDWYYNTAPVSYTVTINGTPYYGSLANYAATATQVLLSGTQEVEHNADGNKSITISFSVTTSKTASYLPGNANASDTMYLTYIPRFATITEVPSSWTDDDNPTIKYSNPAGNSISHLQACISWTGGADIDYRDISKTGSEYTFTLTDAERKKLRQAVTNANGELTVNFFVWSMIGNDERRPYLGSTFKLVDYLPSISAAAYENDYTALTGSVNRIIKGYNNIYYEITPTVRKEATVAGYRVQAGNVSNTAQSGSLSNIETNTINFTVTDSRGNIATIPKTFEMVNYIPLTCNVDGKIELDTEDSTKAVISFTVSGNYFSGSFGAMDNHLDLSYSLEYEGGGISANPIDIPASAINSDGTYSLEYEIPNKLDYRSSYTIKIYAGDKINSDVQSSSKTLKAVPVFDWGENDFNFNVPIKMYGKEMLYVVENGEQDGWTYRKWSNGEAECWKVVEHNTALTNAWGSMYYGTNVERQNYPFPFDGKPIEQVTMTCGGSSAWVCCESSGVNGGWASAIYSIISPVAVSSSQTFYLNYYIKGKLL